MDLADMLFWAKSKNWLLKKAQAPEPKPGVVDRVPLHMVNRKTKAVMKRRARNKVAKASRRTNRRYA
jgi:hypothetical protein